MSNIYFAVLHYHFLARDCGPIGTPANGTKLGSQTTYPNEVVFSCDDGFHLRGSIRRRCTAGGAWSGVEANCQGNVLTQLRKIVGLLNRNRLVAK